MDRDIGKLEAQVAAADTEQHKIDALNALAQAVQEQEPERAFMLATDAHQRSKSGEYAAHPYVSGIVTSLNTLAWYHYEHVANYVTALEYSSEALLLATNINNTYGQIVALYLQGLINHRNGNFPQALSNHIEALDLAHEHGNSYCEAQAHRAIANIYSETKETQKALEHCQAALVLFYGLKDDYHYALMLNNISMMHTEFGDYQKALDYGFQSHAIFSKLDRWSGISVVEDTIAQAYAGLGQYEKAVEYVLKNLELITKYGPKSYQTQALLNVGKIYLDHERPDHALPYLLEALALAQDIDSKSRIYECHQHLSVAYEQRGDSQQALFHLKQYVTVHNDVVNVQSLQKLKLFEVIHRTEHAQAEAATQGQLREQERAYFERLSQMRDQLISTTSHDLKSPLGAILNYVYLLNTHLQTEDEEGQRYLQRIEAQVDQMRELIGDLLDLARLETGRVLHSQDVLLDQFLTQIVADNSSQAQNQGIQLDSKIQPQDLSITIDPRQMRRVLNNLIINALKFTPSGGRVHVAIHQDGDHVMMSVEDTGIGIPKADLPHIFDRFYRVHSEAHQQVDGTGLGLAIVKSIVEQHGGRVGVRSVIGKGSTFSFSLPLSQEAIVPKGMASSYAEQSG